MTKEREKLITETLERYPHAVAAQGGGLVVYSDTHDGVHPTGVYYFVLAPDWDMKSLPPDQRLEIGDLLPYEWGTGPTSMAS